MRYTGLERDGKLMKTPWVERGPKLQDYVYEVTTDSIDALLDKIDALESTIDDLKTRNEILDRENRGLWEVIDKHKIPPAPMTDEARGYGEKRRGGSGD